MVNAGGDLRLLGRHPDGDPWVVGVQHPLAPARLLLALSLDDGAVATSGNYLRYRVYNGRRYGHLLHPQLGYPADTALSLTVVAPTAMRADALATAALVMGRDGLAWLRGQPDVEALMVTYSPSRPDRLLVNASRGLGGSLTLFDGTAIVEVDS
jgi:thiamine biosynthesis lipoprotein